MKITLKKKEQLPYDPVILLCVIYPEEIITEKDTCTPMFFAALFTILGHESNLDVHQQINEYRSYSTYTHEILLNYKKELV